MRSKIVPDDDNPRHGTANGYNNLGCRCVECRAAWAAHHRAQNAKRALRGLPDDDPRHGKPTTYTSWKCRCQACTEAWAEYRRARKAGAAS